MHRKSLSTTGSVLVTRRPPCPWMDARYGWWMPSGKPIWGCYFKTGSWAHRKKDEKRPSVPSNTMNLYTLLISCVYIYIHIFGMILSFNCWLLYPNFLRDLVGGQPELQEFSQQEYLQEVHQKCNEPRWVHNKKQVGSSSSGPHIGSRISGIFEKPSESHQSLLWMGAATNKHCTTLGEEFHPGSVYGKSKENAMFRCLKHPKAI